MPMRGLTSNGPVTAGLTGRKSRNASDHGGVGYVVMPSRVCTQVCCAGDTSLRVLARWAGGVHVAWRDGGGVCAPPAPPANPQPGRRVLDRKRQNVLARSRARPSPPAQLLMRTGVTTKLSPAADPADSLGRCRTYLSSDLGMQQDQVASDWREKRTGVPFQSSQISSPSQRPKTSITPSLERRRN